MRPLVWLTVCVCGGGAGPGNWHFATVLEYAGIRRLFATPMHQTVVIRWVCVVCGAPACMLSMYWHRDWDVAVGPSGPLMH